MGALPTTDLGGYERLRERVESALSFLSEARSVDFKRATVWDDLKRGIPKDVLAMSNCRDGGIIVIGVEEIDNKWNRTGLTDQQLRTYNPDNMLDHVNKYASPSLTFDAAQHTDDKGLKYLLIQVRQFDEIPIVCKKSCGQELRKGALYIRPLGKAESREVQSADEMRELIEIATDKALRKFLDKCDKLGILKRVTEARAIQTDKYDAELEGL